MHAIRVFLALLVLAVAQPARAFTPESGTWWNPAEPGSGFLIEIQDNFLFFAGYLYRPDGQPMWYTSQGTLNGNARFVGVLSSFSGGQCLGCPWRPATAAVGAGGPIEIIFDTEARGRLTWGGRTINIERFDYYLTRTQGDLKTEMMLGEWQLVLDFDSNPNVSYPFYGDVLVFDRVDRAPAPDVFDGCRANNSLDGRCTSSALANHDASGFYQASTGEHWIVVNDDPLNFAYYLVKTGTYQFDGILKVCPKALSNAVTQCLQSSSYRAYPVRGWRSASRTFVTTGSGPSSTEKASSHRLGRSITAALGAGIHDKSAGLGHEEIAARYGFDLSKAPVAELEALTARVGGR